MTYEKNEIICDLSWERIYTWTDGWIDRQFLKYHSINAGKHSDLHF